MGIFGVSRSKVEEMRERRDVDGLIKALKNRDSNIRRAAAAAPCRRAVVATVAPSGSKI